MKKLITFLFLVVSIHFTTTSVSAVNNTVDYFIYNDTIYKLDFSNQVEKKSLANLISLLEIPKQNEDTTFVNQTNRLFNGLALYEIKDTPFEQALAIEISNEFFLSTKIAKEDVIYFVKEEIESEQLGNENTFSLIDEINIKEVELEDITNEPKIEPATIEEIHINLPPEPSSIEEITLEEVNSTQTTIDTSTEDVTIEEVIDLVLPETEAITNPPTNLTEEIKDDTPVPIIKKPEPEQNTTKKTETKQPHTEPNPIESKEKEPIMVKEKNILPAMEEYVEHETFSNIVVTAPNIESNFSKETAVKNNFHFIWPIMLVIAFLMTLTFFTYIGMNKNENQRND